MGILQDIRAKHPEYDDMSDVDLADKLHAKFYSDMPKIDFLTKVGAIEEQPKAVNELMKPGAAQRVLRGVPVLGGFLDEMGAGADAALNYVSGGRAGEPYDQALARRRALIEQSDAEHPVRNTAEALLGGVVSAGSIPMARPFQGDSMLAGAGNAAANAAPLAAATGFAEGEGGFQERVRNAGDYTQNATPIAMVLGGVGQGLANRAAGTPAFGPMRNGVRQPSVARDAGTIGVDVPQFMEGGRASQAVAGKLGAIPFVGDDINRAVGNTRNQLATASQNISDAYGGVGVNPRQAGEAARDAMAHYADDGARAVADRVYEPVNRQMRNVVAPLTNTRQAATELLRQQNEAASPIHARAIAEIDQALNAPNGLSFEGITRLRTRIGTLMDNAIDPENRTARAGLNAVYAGLSRDMEAAIQQSGGQRAQQLWRRANAINARLAQRRDVVARIVGAEGDKAGEGIVDRVVAMASTKSSADAARLQEARRIMGADAWRQTAGAAIGRLGRNQSNEFSPDIFLKNYNQLSAEGRRLLFQSTGQDNLFPHLEALANVSQQLQRFSKLGNPSGTGGVAALLAAMGGAASGGMGATLTTALAGRGIGMLMSRPAVVRNATQHARNMARFLQGRLARAALAATAVNLAREVSKATGEDEKAVLARIQSVTP